MSTTPSQFETWLEAEVSQLKSVPFPVHLSQLSDVVKNDVVKRDVYNAKIKDVEDKISDITNLATNSTLNAKINGVKNKIPSITNLVAATALTAVQKKIPDHNIYIYIYIYIYISLLQNLIS